MGAENRLLRGAALALACAVLLPCRAGAAGIATDGTLGHATTLAGPNYQIGAGLGSQAGSNLFFSFSQFNLLQGQTATFSGPAGIQRIISRVTGGPSSIDGAIQSAIAGSDFYFINPAGIVFGPHASVNVGGSLYISSAHYLKLADGGRFDAASPAASTLTSAPPEAFGFLGGQGAISFSGGSYSTAPGASLNLVGGKLSLDGTQLSAPGGAVRLLSTASAGEMPLGAVGTPAPDGTVSLSNGTQITAPSSGTLPSGSVLIDAGIIGMSQSGIALDNAAAGSGGSLELLAGTALTLDGSSLSQSTSGAGAGGTLRLSAPRLSLLNGASVGSFATGGGNGGKVTVDAGTLDMSGASQIQSLSSSTATGAGGGLDISAASATLAGKSTITSETDGAGRGGDVNVAVQGQLALTGVAPGTPDYINQVSQSGIQTLVNGGGDGGNVSVSADTLSITGFGFVFSQTGAAGNGGSLSLSGGDIKLGSGGFVVGVAGFFVPTGNAGDIGIKASRSLSVAGDGAFDVGSTTVVGSFSFSDTGRGGNISVAAPLVSVTTHGSISASAFDSGNAGDLVIDTQTLKIGGGGTLFAAVFNPVSADAGSITINASRAIDMAGISNSNESQISVINEGNGADGRININTPLLNIDQNSFITADNHGSNASGGSINVLAGAIHLDGVISGSADATGAGPNVSISASQGLWIGDQGTIYTDTEATGQSGNAGALIIHTPLLLLGPNATITTASAGSGAGGKLLIKGGELDLYGTINAQSTGSGAAGSIELSAADIRLLPGAQISTQGAVTNGGNIGLQASGLLYFDQAQLSTSAGVGSAGTGNGGNILIDSPLTVLNGSSILARANTGNGGNIAIDTAHFIASNDSMVSASSQKAVSGSIAISTPVVDIAEGLAPLPLVALDPSRALRRGCAVGLGSGRNSLIARGRGGFPGGAADAGLSALPSPLAGSLSTARGTEWAAPAEPCFTASR
jgi:filamentous hemagglutinin family protein